MKLSITYLYTIFKYGYPPKVEDDFKALADIEEMGFHYLEMEGLGVEHTEGVWSRKEEFKKRLDDHGIHVHNFCGVDPDLVSMNGDRRFAAYERFKRTAELAAFLDAETMHLASYAPPVQYEGQAPYTVGEDYSFRDSFAVRIPDGFSWQQSWDILVESCQHTAEVASQFGRTIIMEPRVGEMICSVDSLLRLIEGVNRNNFQANFDTGHFSAQRENVPLALTKLEGKYANIHVADNDPVNTEHLPIGEGTIDWTEFFRVLKVQNYDGYLGLDLGNSNNTIAEDLKNSVEQIRVYAGKHGIAIEV